MNIDSEIFDSRLIIKTDPIIKEFSWDKLRWDFYNGGWWSRIFEYKWLNDAITSYFDKREGRNVLDAATGTNFPGMYMLKGMGFSGVTGTDLYDLNRMSNVSYMKDGIEYIKDDIVNSQIKKQFDCVCCISVLEHIQQDKQGMAIQNLINCLKPNGCIVLTFDMPGFGYLTDLPLYKSILTKNSLQFRCKDVDEKLIVKSNNSECKGVKRGIARRQLSCYRLFAWR